jgi:anti-sigma factor RsiW
VSQYYNSWEEILANAPSAIKPFSTVESASCDHAWGSRIESIFLEDLSQDERRSLAEHVKTCSACAAHVREYQELEEYARKLPYYRPDVYGHRRACVGAIQSYFGRRVYKGRDREHTIREKEINPIVFVSLTVYVVQLIAVFPLTWELTVKLVVELVVFVCAVGVLLTSFALSHKN